MKLVVQITHDAIELPLDSYLANENVMGHVAEQPDCFRIESPSNVSVQNANERLSKCNSLAATLFIPGHLVKESSTVAAPLAQRKNGVRVVQL